MHGLPVGKLVLTDYDDSWPHIFESEAERIRARLAEFVIDIQHIGSTAVPGMLAKPIIDIGLVVGSTNAIERTVDPMINLGYEYRGLHEKPGHYYSIKNVDGLRVFHLHAYVVPNDEWDSCILFRDNLTRFPDLAAKYAENKLMWAEASGWNKRQYSMLKDEFVAEVLAR